MKFRMKPVVIEAVQWDETYETQVKLQEWMGDALLGQTCEGADIFLRIDTLKGIMRASPNDWVIRGVKGEFYPCKPDIFAATYEAAE